MFFDKYPQLHGNNPKQRARLNHRYNAVIAPHDFVGKTVLDLGANNGRWAIPAAKAGAKSVLGIEGRESHVEAAKRNTADLGVDNVRFLHGDVHDHLDKHNADVVLCLGWLYHSNSICRVFSRFEEIRPSLIVLDTAVHRSDEPVFLLRVDKSAHPLAAIGDKPTVIVERPSVPALRLLADQHGMTFRMFDWAAYLKGKDTTGVESYAEGRRVTVFLSPRC